MTVTINVKGSALAADKITPLLLLDYPHERPGGSNLRDIPGRAKPIVVFRPVRSRRGKIDVLLANETAARAFEALLIRQVTFTLTDTERPSAVMDFVVGEGGVTAELQIESTDAADPTAGLYVGTIQAVEV